MIFLLRSRFLIKYKSCKKQKKVQKLIYKAGLTHKKKHHSKNYNLKVHKFAKIEILLQTDIHLIIPKRSTEEEAIQIRWIFEGRSQSLINLTQII